MCTKCPISDIPLGRQCLPRTGAAMQQDDQSVALALDDVVHGLVSRSLHVDECMDHLFDFLVKNQLSKCVLVPIYLREEAINVEYLCRPRSASSTL